jgi:hypothetical protein
MRSEEWRRLVRPLVPAGERWEVRGSLCYLAPAGRVLVGLLAEGSALDRGVYLWQVSMPLFVPSDVVVLTYSHRIGGSSRKYRAGELDELREAVARGLRDHSTDATELSRFAALDVSSAGINTLEAATCSRALLGNVQGALELIEQASRRETRHEWERVVAGRLESMGRRMREGGLAAVVDQLDAQAAATAEALGVVHR